MLEKIKTYYQNPIWHNLRDVRVLGFLVFGVLVLLASWSGVRVIETNYELQKEIAQIDQQNQVKQLANSNLKLRNEYFNTDTYLELQARKAFGKGAPGETLLLVPKHVALKRAPELPEAKVEREVAARQDGRPTYRKNFDAWMEFIFHRGS